MLDIDSEISKILDLGGFQIFPAGANEQRGRAQSQLKTLINRVVVEGKIEELQDISDYLFAENERKPSAQIANTQDEIDARIAKLQEGVQEE